MKYFDEQKLTGVSINGPSMNGFRTIGEYNGAGFPSAIYGGLANSMWESDATPTPGYLQGTFANGAIYLGNKTCYVVGNARLHGDVFATSFTQLIYFDIGSIVGEDGPDIIQKLILLPWFSKFGNTPVSLTDANLVIIQMYEAGMWFLMEHNRPPIVRSQAGGASKMMMNYQIGYDQCWDGVGSPGITVANLIGTSPNGTGDAVIGSNTAGYARGSNTSNSAPWIETMPFNNNSWLDVSDDIEFGDEITIEYVGQSDDTAATDFLCDARGGGGGNFWIANNVSGYDFNWFGQCFGDTPTVAARQGNRHHFIGTANSQVSVNSSKMYFGDSTSVLGTTTEWQQMATGIASAGMTNVGVDFQIASNWTNGIIFNGYMSMFRVWNCAMDANEAKILWLHQKQRIVV